MLILLLLFLSLPAWSAKNLVTTTNGVGTVTLKAAIHVTPSTPVTLIYAANTFHLQAGDAASFVGTGPQNYLQMLSLRVSGGMLQCVDSFDSNQSGILQADIRGWEQYGVSVVCERNPDKVNGPDTGHLSMRVCRMDGSHCQNSSLTAAFTSTTLAAMNIGRAGWNPGPNAFYGDVAVIGLSDKLYNSGVPPNGSGAPTGSVAHWEFEDTLSDSVGGAYWSLDWGEPHYTDTAHYAPYCSTGGTQTFATKQTGKLWGYGYTLNGSPQISYWWDQMSGPSTLTWTGRDTATPSLTGQVFGEYALRLQVKDSDGTVTMCSVTDGTADTDDRGILVIANPTHAKYFSANPVSRDPGTGAPGLISSVPAGQGINAYPYWSSQVRVMADVVLNAASLFPQEWNIPLAGTVSIPGTCYDYGHYAPGQCKGVTGTGTKFRTSFCNADGSPKASVHFVAWYPSLLYPGKTGRRMFDVTHCDSDANLSLNNDFMTYGVVDGSRMQNVQYAMTTDAVSSAYWGRYQATGGYYDNAVALLYMHYATGLTKYLNGFRVITDAMWTYPTIDRGSLYIAGGNTGGWIYSEARNEPVISFILRAADEVYTSGLPGGDRWVGIRRLVDWNRGNFQHGFVSDLRNAGFTMEWMSLLALLDPDESKRNEWWQKVRDAWTRSWEPSKVTEGNQVYWIAEDASHGGAYSFGPGPVYTGVAHVTQGSTAVTGTGTNFLHSWTWTSASGTVGYPDQQGVNGCLGSNTGKIGWIWFAPTTAAAPLVGFKPQGERYAYRVARADSNTQMALKTPYAGATGDRAYGCIGDSSEKQGGDGTFFGVQPFMLTIAADGFIWAREAALQYNDSVLTGAFRDAVIGIATFIKDRAWSKNYGGNTYWTVSPTAETPDEADRCSGCIANYPGDIAGARINLIESFRALGYLWRFVPSDALAQETDIRMGKMWGKPNTGGLTSDPHYVSEAEGFWTPLGPPDVVSGRLGWKWFGYMAGTGMNWGWPASRVGGLITATHWNIPVILFIALMLLLVVAVYVRLRYLQPRPKRI